MATTVAVVRPNVDCKVFRDALGTDFRFVDLALLGELVVKGLERDESQKILLGCGTCEVAFTDDTESLDQGLVNV